MIYPTYTPIQVLTILASIPEEVVKVMRNKYSIQKSHGKRGDRAPMKMAFNQWAAIWWDSGKWHLRGRTKDKPYQMCRKDDIGDYEMGNVRIDTHQSNNADAYEKQAAAVSTANKFKWQDTEFRVRQAAAVKLACSKPIQGTNKKTGEVRVWDSLMDASRELNAAFQNISNAANGRQKSAAGFTWKYLENL